MHKVAFLTTGLATGGAEMMLLKLCSRLDQRRFSAAVISLADKGIVGPQIEALGVPVHALGIDARKPSPLALRRLSRLLAGLRPDLLQGWMYHGNLAATLTSGSRPVSWGIRQSLYDIRRERLLTRWVIRAGALLSHRCDAIVYNGHTSAAQHEAFGFAAKASRIIANGFDTERFRPDERARTRVRQELGLRAVDVVIGLVSRYHPMKDHGNFLRAAALLLAEFPDVRFVLAGHGVDQANPAIAAAVAEYSLAGRVALLGERRDIPELYAAMDIACSASAWGEAFANAIGEAMSCGLPCTVTDVGDSALIVGDTGTVVPRQDASALAAAWRNLIMCGDDGRRALGVRARERMIENFSLDSIVRQYELLYEQLI